MSGRRDARLVAARGNGQNMTGPPPSLREPMRQPRPAARLIVCAVLCATASVAAEAAQQTRPSAAQPGASKRTYSWVDNNNVTHFGDSIPAEYADQDKTVLNQHGVPIGTIEGHRTPEQIAAAARAKAAEERARQDVLLSRQRDQNLLATYLTVGEIESLRDRRVEILDAQARVTSQYLDQVRTRLGQLEEQAKRFKPYNAEPNAPLLPERLSEDLVRTVSEIRSQERNLETKRQETDKLKAQFAQDIARFKELKRIESDYVRSTPSR